MRDNAKLRSGDTNYTAKETDCILCSTAPYIGNISDLRGTLYSDGCDEAFVFVLPSCERSEKSQAGQ